ncbi:MAG: hypothetical protein M1818_000449 [Claussenomyces sp. TS43310]|nr:MAG: hypothetical protein M1818_000449 [Claussenomyces sp. TS43310]
MALLTQAQKDVSNAIESSASTKFNVLGHLWLDDPEGHLSKHALDRLRDSEPHFRALDARMQPSKDPPRRQEEAVPPAGRLTWPIAHHLHNPNFMTKTPHTGETADLTSPCTALIMANTFVKDETLIYDHLARREITDGLIDYPQKVLLCHEAWLSTLRKNMFAKVETIYGRVVQNRMFRIYELEPLKLWGKLEGITIYLEWTSSTLEIPKAIIRILVFAIHPQFFLLPWGKKFAKTQDQLNLIAHNLEGLPCNNKFCEDWDWSFINRFPKLQHYKQQQGLAREAFIAVMATKELICPESGCLLQARSYRDLTGGMLQELCKESCSTATTIPSWLPTLSCQAYKILIPQT